MKTKASQSVFAEIHQRGMEVPMVVVPNEVEVESLLLCLNHQLPAFLLNYSPANAKMPLEFVEALLKKSCDSELFNEAYQCKWDKDNWVMIRPEDERNQQKEAERTKDKWCANIVSTHLAVSQTPVRPTQWHKHSAISTPKNL